MENNIRNNTEIIEINKIENKYGAFLFRMALTHLISVGFRNFTEENVAESIEKIEGQGRKDKDNGVYRLMTSEAECAIVRCAAELSKLEIWDLLRYVTKFVDVGFGII